MEMKNQFPLIGHKSLSVGMVYHTFAEAWRVALTLPQRVVTIERVDSGFIVY